MGTHNCVWMNISFCLENDKINSLHWVRKNNCKYNCEFNFELYAYYHCVGGSNGVPERNGENNKDDFFFFVWWTYWFNESTAETPVAVQKLEKYFVFLHIFFSYNWNTVKIVFLLFPFFFLWLYALLIYSFKHYSY